MLLKHIYRVGRAANHQSNTDMDNYENRLLNEPITAIIRAGYDNNFFSHLHCRAKQMNFLLARVAKLVAHARFLKSAILIKIGDMFVKWILKGRKCDKSSK